MRPGQLTRVSQLREGGQMQECRTARIVTHPRTEIILYPGSISFDFRAPKTPPKHGTGVADILIGY